ncbi:MAG TPA: TetR/AcrR family transcriptional regulator [Candidatus Cloacimonadota bacterium]|nr:TetR/AcrR family transcriptional regulator [Candidatus Cloacimonadota bacterium]
MPTQSETEERILSAATEIFLSKGKEGARMQDIANHAKINKALLHYYFRSKDHLYYIVFEMIFTKFIRSFMMNLHFENDFKSDLRNFIYAYIDAISKNQQIFRFFVWEIHSRSENIGKIIPKVFENLGYRSNPFIEIIERAIETNQIRRVEPAQLFINIVSLCVFPFLAKPIIENFLPVTQISMKSYTEDRKRVVFDFIWNGIQPNLVEGVNL